MTARNILLSFSICLCSAAVLEAGDHFCRRYAPVSVGHYDYAPYSYAPVPSVHGPVFYDSGVQQLPSFHRSYYRPVQYGYGRPYGLGAYATPYRGWGYGYRGYGYRGYHLTSYGIYGGSYTYLPLSTGYRYNTGYVSVVRPVQPYVHAYQISPSPLPYTPCVYGAYGYGAF